MENKKTVYTCPMHTDVKSDKPGKCPKCGMDLVLESELVKQPASHVESASNSYFPLVVIVGLILLVSILTGDFVLTKTVSNFMAGFFLVFSGFKLMDLKSFAQGYSTYDLLAKRWFSYGYIYPFIELFFGLAMIINFQPRFVLWSELIIMTFSGLGVAIKLAKHEKFQCACLGTFLKVPLTKVTLIEDFGMALLAGLLLIMS